MEKRPGFTQRMGEFAASVCFLLAGFFIVLGIIGGIMNVTRGPQPPRETHQATTDFYLETIRLQDWPTMNQAISSGRAKQLLGPFDADVYRNDNDHYKGKFIVLTGTAIAVTTEDNLLIRSGKGYLGGDGVGVLVRMQTDVVSRGVEAGLGDRVDVYGVWGGHMKVTDLHGTARHTPYIQGYAIRVIN